MIINLLKRIKHYAISEDPKNSEKLKSDHPIRMSHRELITSVNQIPYWEKKIELYKKYVYEESTGYWIKLNRNQSLDVIYSSDLTQLESISKKINYGCGSNLIEGWLNVDLYQLEASNYKAVNLLDRHPFQNNSINFGFSEDMLEHLTQAESIFFLGEVYRTLKVDGLLRLSFPGLEGVLKRHYSPFSASRLREGEFEAYSFWDHIHFYSKEELSLIANHIGFKRVEFVEYGKSKNIELCDLDTRQGQIGLNTYVELLK